MLLASREYELELLEQFPLVLGMDEVGRGAIAGPVSVGVCVVDRDTSEAPAGLADSKLVSASKRGALAEAVATWSVATHVASSPATEIDEVGIIRALRRAGMRALTALAEQEIFPSAIILDGTHDWLTPPEVLDLWAGPEDQWPVSPLPVYMRVKGDRECAVVAGASMVAKVSRDAYMAALPDPGYGWAKNKGYASAGHRAALQKLGVSAYHRQSWKLPL
ncbi:ribonuclease HII [Boudabousia marimammalium]|uniref:Ribonuclease n=1 Tax=Boudabousia marimammalium TaxID=156892 RepID=A0A1Q5PR63_9ACTO|nr:ribonuclease HII [Boudabousia marimammalium]OKL50128.1 ribonuclease HII [Boudabousia marimammalium]